MKKNVFILLLTLVTLSLSAKEPTSDKVDPAIEAKFKNEFGATVNVSWEVIQGVSIATYSDNGEDKQVYYFNDGEIFAFGKAINKALLPSAVTRSLNSRFGSSVIESVYEFKAANSSTRYFVRLVNHKYSMIVSANEFDELVVLKKVRLK